MSRIIARDGRAYCRADQIIPGDSLDLQGDMFADPEVYLDSDAESSHPEFEFELCEVLDIMFEPHDVDPVIVLETTAGTFGFPVDHEIDVELFADGMTWDQARATLEDGYRHTAGNSFAKLLDTKRRGVTMAAWAKIMHNDHGDHWIKYLPDR